MHTIIVNDQANQTDATRNPKKNVGRFHRTEAHRIRAIQQKNATPAKWESRKLKYHPKSARRILLPSKSAERYTHRLTITSPIGNQYIDHQINK